MGGLKGEKDGNRLASLCSECSDDFYWVLEKRFDLREPHSCPLTRHKARVVGGILLGEPPLCQKMDKCLRSECEGGVEDVLPISKKVGVAREERREWRGRVIATLSPTSHVMVLLSCD